VYNTDILTEKGGSSQLLTNKKLAKIYVCRRCLNDGAKIKYKNYELKYKYYYYHFKCSKCGGMHHIVKGVKFLYLWKLLFTKNPLPESAEDIEMEKAILRNQRKTKLKRWFHW